MTAGEDVKLTRTGTGTNPQRTGGQSRANVWAVLWTVIAVVVLVVVLWTADIERGAAIDALAVGGVAAVVALVLVLVARRVRPPRR